MTRKLSHRQLRELRQEAPGPSGNRVRAAMKMLDLTQDALAADTGLSQQYISAVTRGKHYSVTVENAHPFAERFGCAIEDLFPKQSAERRPQSASTPSQRRHRPFHAPARAEQLVSAR